MYVQHRLYLTFFWLLGFYASLVLNLDFLGDVAGHVLTVLSIFFGFYMTSAATICSSSLYPKLHQEMDSQASRAVRLSQTLKNYFRFGFNSLLVGIILFLAALLLKKGGNGVVSFASGYNGLLRYFYNGLLGGHIALCLTFAFIQTRLFITSFMNIAYCENKK